MRKIVLLVVLLAIALPGSSQTFLDPTQMKIPTNMGTLGYVTNSFTNHFQGSTNLQQFFEWLDKNWPDTNHVVNATNLYGNVNWQRLTNALSILIDTNYFSRLTNLTVQATNVVGDIPYSAITNALTNSTVFTTLRLYSGIVTSRHVDVVWPQPFTNTVGVSATLYESSGFYWQPPVVGFRAVSDPYMMTGCAITVGMKMQTAADPKIHWVAVGN